MLRYRLIFGPIMIVALIAILYVDAQLDRISLQDTFLQPLLLGRTYLPSGLLMLAMILIVIVLGTRELGRIFHAKQIATSPFMLALSGVLGCLLIYILPHRMETQTALAIYATVLVGVFMLALIRYSWKGRTEGAVSVAGATLFTLIYFGTMPGFYMAIRRWHSVWIIAAIVLITKSCDIGAYFSGRWFGKHKLIPWLSPGKTWEGLVGGVLFSGIVALGMTAAGNSLGLAGVWTLEEGQRVFTAYQFPLWFAFLGGLALGLVGQLGDLTASLFKRDAGIKDSGQSIPGFGGVLDVLDSPLVVAPVAFWMLQMIVAISPTLPTASILP